MAGVTTFCSRPCRTGIASSIYAQAFGTTNEFQFHTIENDAPYLFDQPHRLRASLIYEKNVAANYFGLGALSLRRLSFPESGERFASQNDHTDSAPQDRYVGRIVAPTTLEVRSRSTNSRPGSSASAS